MRRHGARRGPHIKTRQTPRKNPVQNEAKWEPETVRGLSRGKPRRRPAGALRSRSRGISSGCAAHQLGRGRRCGRRAGDGSVGWRASGLHRRQRRRRVCQLARGRRGVRRRRQRPRTHVIVVMHVVRQGIVGGVHVLRRVRRQGRSRREGVLVRCRRWWGNTGAERRGRERAALVRELLGPRAGVRALEESAFVAQDFSRIERRAPPGRCVGGAAVEAPAPDTVAQLRRGVVGIDGRESLPTRIRVHDVGVGMRDLAELRHVRSRSVR